jgi:hypothetical protein
MDQVIQLSRSGWTEFWSAPVSYLLISSYYLVLVIAAYTVFIWLFSLFASKTFRNSHGIVYGFVANLKPVTFAAEILTTVIGGTLSAIGGILSAIADLVSSALLFTMNLISVPLGFLNGRLSKIVSVLQEGAHKQKMKSLEIRLQRQIDRNRRKEEIDRIQSEISNEQSIANNRTAKGDDAEQLLH